jgi:hypothetical protein
MLRAIPGPSPLIVAGRSKPFSALLCSIMSDTRVHCRSENRSLKLVVSGSLASSMMLPTELAVSDSVSDMFTCLTIDFRVNVRFVKYAKIAMSRDVASSCLWWGKALRLVCAFVGETAGSACWACRSASHLLPSSSTPSHAIRTHHLHPFHQIHRRPLRNLTATCWRAPGFLMLCVCGAIQLIAPSIAGRSAMPSSSAFFLSAPNPHHFSSSSRRCRFICSQTSIPLIIRAVCDIEIV